MPQNKINDFNEENDNIQNIPSYNRFKYPLVLYSKLEDGWLNDILDTGVTAIERYPHDNDKCCKLLKDFLDKQYTPSWNVIIGSNFSCEITYESYILHFYCGIDVAVLLWKCSNYPFGRS